LWHNFSVRSVHAVACLIFLLRVHSFLFSILCSGIVGTLEVLPADMIGPEFWGTHLWNYSLMGSNL